MNFFRRSRPPVEEIDEGRPVPATVVGTVLPPVHAQATYVTATPSAPPLSFSDAPPPYAPTAPPMSFAAPEVAAAGPASVAEEYAECAICFDELYKAESGVFVTGSGRRVCHHFFHRECAAALDPKHCPLCRRPFARVHGMPRLLAGADRASLRRWFAAVDVDGDGKLSKEEVLNAMLSEVQADSHRLRRDVDALWARWDRDRSGYLDQNEVAALFEYVSREYAPRARAPPPSLESNREAFFDYWDEDRNGTLDKEEVIRALLKTFGLASHGHRAVAEMRETIENVWCLFDDDGNGTIDRGEWAMRDGLCDAVIAARQFR